MLVLTSAREAVLSGRVSEHRGEAAEGAMRSAIEQQYLPLIRTIEAEIIPRLLLAHKGQSLADGIADERGEIPSQAHVLEFAGLVLTQSSIAAAGYIEAMVDQGYLLETLYLGIACSGGAPSRRTVGTGSLRFRRRDDGARPGSACDPRVQPGVSRIAHGPYRYAAHPAGAGTGRAALDGLDDGQGVLRPQRLACGWRAGRAERGCRDPGSH